MKVLEECYALEDEVTMQQVMAELTKLHGPITGVIKNSGKVATPQVFQPSAVQSSRQAGRRSVA